MKERIRMVLVDSHALVRKAVRRLLVVDPAITVLAEAETPEHMERALRRHHPDILILDPALHNDDGLTLIRVVRARYPALPILIISQHKETLFAEAALRAGAQGYLMKNDAPDHLMEAVYQVVRGQIYVSETIRQGIFAKLRLDASRRPGTRSGPAPDWTRPSLPVTRGAPAAHLHG
jgi:DNA-binding NarL/FixJ family response regulator